MSDWQTMDSAPKDGTKILVWTVHGEIELTEYYRMKHYVYEAVGDLFERREEVFGEGWNGNRPVLWQPLPLPPDATEARKA